MKLQEIFDYFDKQEITIPDYIMNQYNKFSSLLGDEMTSTEANGLYYVITNRLAKLMNCYTIYDDEEEGVTAVQTIIKHNIINLTVEIRNMLKVVLGDIATTHSQTKFNPVDNDSIDKAPISMDNLGFTKGENYVAQCDYLMENSKTLGYLYTEFANMCYLTNYISKAESTPTSTKYATKTALEDEVNARTAADATITENLNSEITARKGADETLEAYCESLDATKAAQSDLESEIETRSANEKSISDNLSKEVEARQSADATLQANIEEVEAKIPSVDNFATKDELTSGLATKQDTISKYSNDASVSDNTLTITFSNGDSTSFTPTSQTGGITDVQVTDTSGTASVVTSGVATIDLTGYATTSDVNTKTNNLQTEIDNINNTTIPSVEESLEGQITSEASTRASADTTLQSNIDKKVSKSGDSMTGTLVVLGGVVAAASTGDTAIVNVSQSSNSYIEFQSETGTLGYIGVNSSKKPVFYDTEDKQLATTDDIPTKTSELTNDSGYITSSSIPTLYRYDVIIKTGTSSIASFMILDTSSSLESTLSSFSGLCDYFNGKGWTSSSSAIEGSGYVQDYDVLAVYTNGYTTMYFYTSSGSDKYTTSADYIKVTKTKLF